MWRRFPLHLKPLKRFCLLGSPLCPLRQSGEDSLEIATPEGQQTGLLTDSVIMTDNLVTVLDIEIDRAIGIWSDMLSIDVALKHTFGI